MNNYHRKVLYPRCVWGPKSTPEIYPDRTQTECTQVTEKTLKKKRTGQNLIVCLYFPRDIYPISLTFIKLIFKIVNGMCVDDIKRKAVPVIYNGY